MLLCFGKVWTLCVLLAAPSLATIVNRTIDDTYGDEVTGQKPLYLPSRAGVWQNRTCTVCDIKPDESLAHNGTWTAVVYHPNMDEVIITLRFTGVAIYVFFITANNAGPGVSTNTSCIFTLDGDNPYSAYYSHIADESTQPLEYDVLAFSKAGLENGNHTLTIVPTGPLDSYVNVDYALYTSVLQNIQSSH
ncbi:hypothetical protein AMATHDRAFT_141988 [Amanita thiersii Skay4041]|uniref:Uncharacterized protein n=1 Tax=Amanita thiersii Skay4041 TaxID=703135 RepID=A0A2A9NQR8_9AGAR|nr:hypothetical protein AMATHDRAFT_141988 [Amanita thiersii Skay4041]